MRYPVPRAPNGQHGPGPSVFMSASGRGAHAWSSPSHSQPLDPAEEELVTFSRESPFSQLEDDPQVSLSRRCSHRALFRNAFHVLRLCMLIESFECWKSK